jgi:hypothetical protein
VTFRYQRRGSVAIVIPWREPDDARPKTVFWVWTVRRRAVQRAHMNRLRYRTRGGQA